MTLKTKVRDLKEANDTLSNNQLFSLFKSAGPSPVPVTGFLDQQRERGHLVQEICATP